MTRLAFIVLCWFVCLPVSAQYLVPADEKAEYSALPALKTDKYESFEEYVSVKKIPPEYFYGNTKSGSAVIAFTVKQNGKVTGVRPIYSTHRLIEEEARRVVKRAGSMTWQPALDTEGRPVDALMHAVVFFGDNVRPSFGDGGIDRFSLYVHQHIKYPRELAKKGITGRVVVEFAVGADGTVEEIYNENGRLISPKVKSSPHDGLSWEVIKVMLGAPKFFPAFIDGKPSRCEMVMPIAFKLSAPPHK